MNMQAIMQQAKKMQKDMTDAKEKIDKTVYEEKNEFVDLEMYGTIIQWNYLGENNKLQKDLTKIISENIDSEKVIWTIEY